MQKHNNKKRLSNESYKYLGVLTDSKLDWSSHIQVNKRKLLNFINLFLVELRLLHLLPLRSFMSHSQ